MKIFFELGVFHILIAILGFVALIILPYVALFMDKTSNKFAF